MSWGVLAYVVADDRSDAGDSLDEVAELDLERLRIAAANAGIPLAAQIDYQAKPGRWRQVFGTSTATAKLREANSSRPDVLADFLDWGVKNCEADHYVVMLWGHGSGPAGFFSDASQNTPARVGHPLSPVQLSKALTAVASELPSKAPGEGKFDIVLLKACFAATVEVAFQLENAADFIIASQSLIPGQTFWPYPRLFQALTDAGGRARSAKKEESEFVATEILNIIGAFYGNDANRPGKLEVPYSLLKTATSQKVADGLTGLATAWQAAGSPDISDIAARCSPSDPGLLDVARLCETLMDIGEEELSKAAKQLRADVEKMVIGRHPEVSEFRGVSVFYHPGYGMPSPARDTAQYGLYRRSRLAQYNQPNPGQASVGTRTPTWVEIAYQNTAIAKLAQGLLAEQEGAQ